MTASQPAETRTHPTSDGLVVGSPLDADGPRYSLYTPEFAADPHRVYEDMRHQFPSGLVPVELAPDVPATLVISHQAAIQILHDPDRFPADPRKWQKTMPADHPLMPMLEWRPNASRTSGTEHERYAEPNRDSIGRLNTHTLRGVIEKYAIELINGFCTGHGSDQWVTVDLLSEYIYPLVYRSLGWMLGFDADTMEQVGRGMAAVFDASADSDAGDALLTTALTEHIERKKAHGGDDITTSLIEHPNRLSDEELLHMLVNLHGSGSEPQVHLISNALLLLVTDKRFGGSLLDGSLHTREALDEVLFANPPLQNYCITYPRQPTLIDHVWLPAHQPVMVSISACNADPAVRSSRQVHGNRSHLAFSTGEHHCPARNVGYMIAVDAIDQLLDALADMELAIPEDQLVWRPGPIHRALTYLPVTFPSTPPLNIW